MAEWDDPTALRRSDFPVTYPITTRWSDVDAYGHLNNAVYYFIIDTAVNGWLMRATNTDIRTMPGTGVVAETSCRYLSELYFPSDIEVGIALERIGRTSVIYRLGIFGPDEAPAALGRFVHVYIDDDSRRPVAIPDPIRDALMLLK